jgi:hypothetical protein
MKPATLAHPAVHSDVATRFVSRCILHPTVHTDAERLFAVQELLKAAGFNAVAACWPTLDGAWPEACRGPHGAAATLWLLKLTDTMPRRFGDQRQFVAEAVAELRKMSP